MSGPNLTVQDGSVGLQVEHLRKSYRKKVVIRDFSMHLDRGEVVALLGPNGSGKTTTFYAIAGLVMPEGGTVRIVEGDTPRVELVSKFYNPISSDYAQSIEVGLLESSRVLSAVLHNINTNEAHRVPQQGRWTYRLDPKNYKKFRTEVRKLLENQIKEGDALLEKFEETQKRPGQLTVGIGWYQWGDHDSESIGE
jgi:ABC-type cobalamin/Fe3+-siderophores transport system ATPase subunit